MKVRDFVENASVTTNFCVKTKEGDIFTGDKYEIALLECVSEYDVTFWFIVSDNLMWVNCEKVEEFQSMKECIDEFFDFVDDMGMSRMI